MKKKGQATFDKILTATMKSYSIFGDKGTTFQSIADLAGVSQPLVAKYFKTREAVLPAAIDRFLLEAREVTIKAIDKAKNPRAKLSEYIRVSIEMFRQQPEIFKIYLLLHYYAGFDEFYKNKNTEIRQVAVDRLNGFIQEGIKIGTFRKCNPESAAKVIHNALVGTILGIATEKSKFTDTQLIKSLEDFALGYLKPDDTSFK